MVCQIIRGKYVLMKILVTGGAGYLGSIIVPHLLAEGHEVTVLDALLFRQASLLECCANPRFDFVQGDCRNEDTVKTACREIRCHHSPGSHRWCAGM
jgi:nucleoside-diphosphate-sugar epimerase